ncbi:MAG TPA: hypothetical protein VF459_20835 [Caulobacteraceae bacterium]
MNRIFIAAAAVLAFAGAANAEGVAVKVAGKSPEAVKHDIKMAARKVCDDELSGVFDNYFMKDACVTDAVARAEAQLGTIATASAATQGHDAAATVH